jgi:hypothetical protein
MLAGISRDTMTRIDKRLQFSASDLLQATVWFAIACIAVRFVFIELGMRLEHLAALAVVLFFVLPPFAAAGAIFDRMGIGIACGLAVVLAVALLAVGVR